VSYGIETHSARTTGHTHGRHAAAEHTTRSYGRSEAHDPTPHRSTRRQHQDMITKPELWNRDAQRMHGQGTQRRHAAAEDTTRSYGRSEAHELDTASTHRGEAPGYDHEAVSYEIGDAQRMHGQSRRTDAAQQRRTPRVLWEKRSARPHHTVIESPQRGSTRIRSRSQSYE
jgi:hypothetical protein